MKSSLFKLGLLLSIYCLAGGSMAIFSQEAARNDQAAVNNAAVHSNIKVEEIQFEGNKIFSDQELLDSMKGSGENPGSYCSPPVEYNPEELDYCFRRATFYLRSKGYLQAKLGEPKKQKTERGLKIIVPIAEGKLYRIGEIKIDGSRVFMKEQLLGMLNLNKGDVADGEAILEWLQGKLKTAYEELGYIQYEYDVDPTFISNPEDTNEGVIDFQITITEGKQFTIRKIKFLGTSSMSDADLRQLLFIHEGDIYNRKTLIDSLKNLYQLGLSNGDSDRDVDYLTNDEEGQLDILIALKGYKRQGQNESNGRYVVKRRAPSSN